MGERLREIRHWVSRHPRMAASLVGLYLLLAALGWWGSFPPPLGSIGTDAAQQPWSLAALPAPGGTQEALARLLAHPPWPQAVTSEPKPGSGSRHRAGSRLPRRGPQVGTWSLVGIVNSVPGTSQALFLDPTDRLHRVLPGTPLPGKAHLVSIGMDSILVRFRGQNRLRRLYAPAPRTAAATPGTSPSPQPPKSGS